MKRVPLLRNELLVRGDHVTAALEGREMQVARRRRAADDLDDDLDVRVLEQPERIGRHREVARVTRLAPVADGGADQPERTTRGGVETLAAIGERARDGRADRAEPEQRDADRCAHWRMNTTRSARRGYS